MNIVIKRQQIPESIQDGLTEWEIPAYDEEYIAKLDRIAALFPPLSDAEKQRFMDIVRQIRPIQNPIGAADHDN